MKTKRTQPLPPKHCKFCSTEFTPGRVDQVYCTPKCRLSHFHKHRFSSTFQHLRHVLSELEKVNAFPQLQAELRLVIAHLESESRK